MIISTTRIHHILPFICSQIWLGPWGKSWCRMSRVYYETGQRVGPLTKKFHEVINKR
jgi:hypothetical protein